MQKRVKALTACFVFIFSALIGRCGYIALSDNYTVSDSYNSYKITIGELNTNIYDRNGLLLNNNQTERVAVIPPAEKAIAELNKLFSADEAKEIYDELSGGYPVKRIVSKNVNTEHILQYYKIIENPENMLAKHILNRDYGGLEQYVSKRIGELSVNFGKYASGSLLKGDNASLINDNYDSDEGIVTSLDKEIQKIAEDASKSISRGAVVVLDAETSQILASVSCGGDYVNRALSPYSVGSVFKLVVCACALENNVNQLYKCNSYINVGDTTFNCLKNKAHGMQNMKSALANSCNCYFVKLALKLGADRLYDTAEKLGFGKDFNLYQNWKVSSGSFPSKELLKTYDGQLALTGFGQGQITDSPVHFASVIACIANGGIFNSPVLDVTERKGEKAISNSTAKKLREYMLGVVKNGTGAAADFNGKTAGKTATAQSGIYNNGKEVLNTWFAGFYPYKNPEYAIVVMQEDGNSGAQDCCPVFRTIVEKLDNM